MLRAVSVFVRCVLFLAFLAASPCRAGAFLLPEGQGQFIAGVGYSEGSRRFDSSGNLVAAPKFQKAEAAGYLEYGLTPRLSLIVAPTLAHERDAPATNAFTGSDGSAFGARYQLAGAVTWVVALQALAQPPIGDMRHASVDLRAMFARSLVLFGTQSFIDFEPGGRLRGGEDPSEARFDTAFGLRFRASTLLLVQTFTTIAPAGPIVASSSYTKGQASIVHDFSPKWSVQAGLVRTLFGHNAVRETGPLLAVWYRF